MAYSNMNNSQKEYERRKKEYEQKLNEGYKPSAEVNQWQTKSNEMLSNAEKMGEFGYASKYTDKIESLLDDAVNMKFNYSLTDDPTYQTYRDQAVHQGQLAAKDAMAQTVANSGGYGSTAAQAASQQAYNEQLTQLNNIVPSLYQQAYNVFSNERSSLQNLAAAYQSLDEQTFNQELSTWTTNFNKWMSLASEYNERYEYLDQAQRHDYETQLSGLYNLLTSSQSQYQADQSYDISRRQLAKASSGGGGGGRGRSGSGGNGNGGGQPKAIDSTAAIDFINSHQSVQNIDRVMSDLESYYKSGKLTDQEAAALRQYYQNKSTNEKGQQMWQHTSGGGRYTM